MAPGLGACRMAASPVTSQPRFGHGGAGPTWQRQEYTTRVAPPLAAGSTPARWAPEHSGADVSPAVERVRRGPTQGRISLAAFGTSDLHLQLVWQGEEGIGKLRAKINGEIKIEIWFLILISCLVENVVFDRKFSWRLGH